jgi:hypothetical protein
MLPFRNVSQLPVEFVKSGGIPPVQQSVPWQAIRLPTAMK